MVGNVVLNSAPYIRVQSSASTEPPREATIALNIIPQPACSAWRYWLLRGVIVMTGACRVDTTPITVTQMERDGQANNTAVDVDELCPHVV